MKYLAFVALFALGGVLSGCASVVEGTTQSIAVTTSPADGAQCTLTNSQGTWYVITPGNAQVHKTKTDLDVICKKQGYQDVAITVSPHFNGATFGNVIAGGIVGVGVDAATGANYNYQPLIAVPMTAVGAAQAPSSAGSAPAPNGVSTAHVDPTLPHADPVYPDSAQAAGEQGVVEVNVYVQPNGRVAKAQIVRSSGFADLDNSAMEAVLNWRFVPAARYGDPYSDWTKVEIAFRPPVAPPQPASPAPTAPASKK